MSVSHLLTKRAVVAAALISVCLLGGVVPCSLQAQNVTLAPVIATAVGNGTEGCSSDGPAISAQLRSPRGVAVDRAGNLYIANFYCGWVQRVDRAGNIVVVAGNPTGYDADNIPATSAYVRGPSAVAIDDSGNLLYISEEYRVRKVDVTTGMITTVVGTGQVGYNGDDIPATSAQVNMPYGLAVNGAGELFIADVGNNRIRKVDASPQHIITTVAGNGTAGSSGDGGPATVAQLASPWDVAVDSTGNLYIVDTANNRIRKVDASPQHIITTVAGTGTGAYSGDGGPANTAELYSPAGLAVDSAGNLYITDRGNNRVRKVDASPQHIITTVAGNGNAGFSGDGGPATNAQLNPQDVALDSNGNLYIADAENSVIRKVDRGPVSFGQVNLGASRTQSVFLSINVENLMLVSVQASGDYSVLSSDCPLETQLEHGQICTLQAQFTPTKPGPRWFPLQVIGGCIGYKCAVGPNLFSFGLQGTGVGPALAFTPGIISTVVGNGSSTDLNNPAGVSVDSAGNVYIADSSNNRIRKVDASGTTSTVAGKGTYGYSGDNDLATNAELANPQGVAVDSAGNLYIADTGNSRIRKVAGGSKVITTVTGNGGWPCSSDLGDGSPAVGGTVCQPFGVAVDSVGNLYIADTENQRIRKVDPSGIITTVAGGTLPQSGIGDDGPATSALLRDPVAVAADSSGNLYIVDDLNFRIRKVDTNGIITTEAGNGTQGYGGDGGPAINAEFAFPIGVAVDSAGNLYIADEGSNGYPGSGARIRKVDAVTKSITTVAGNGTLGYGGDAGPATSAGLNPYGVAVDSAGNLFVADTDNNRIRKVDVSTSALSFGSVNVGQTSEPQTLVLSNVGNIGLDFGHPFDIDGFPDFSVQQADNDCRLLHFLSIPLEVAASCNLGVVFTPSVAGDPLTGTLTVSDTAFNSPQTVSLRGVAVNPYKAIVQQPINSDGSSVFSASRGVVPVRFSLTYNDSATCDLPPATIAVTRTAGGTLGSIGEDTYIQAADVGSNFRIDSTACLYAYNLAARNLGLGTYRVDILINGNVVGNAVFALK